MVTILNEQFVTRSLERAAFLLTARSMLESAGPTDALWLEQGPQDPASGEGVLLDLMRWRLDAMHPEAHAHSLRMRHEFLRLLVHKHERLSQRFERAIGHVSRRTEYFSGWYHLVADGKLYQLGAPKPWWRAGSNPVLDAKLIDELGSSRAKLTELGFVQLDPAVYHERVRMPLMDHLLTTQTQPRHELVWAATAMVLMAKPLRDWRQLGFDQLIDHAEGQLVLGCHRALSNQHALIPMKPLYSLPRESNNISTFFVSRSNLSTNTEDASVTGALSHAKAIVRKRASRKGQQVLFADEALVNKSSGAGDAFISVEIDAEHADPIEALTHASEQLNIDAKVLEHLPRVCAGMFMAAHRDKHLDLEYPGIFWDTESGYRLCRIVGFDPENWRHRQRIQSVRDLLEGLIIHRDVMVRDERGERKVGRIKAPIIEARRSELELDVENREGLSAHGTFRSWSINRFLWEMTLPIDLGGTPAFMVIDQRAFALDETSSLPFNLYWTLINRAYMGGYAAKLGDRLSEDGVFRPKLSTLYDWAGLERAYRKVGRVQAKLVDAFERMRHHGLLLSWECPELQTERIAFDKLLNARVSVRFPDEHINLFPTPIPQIDLPIG